MEATVVDFRIGNEGIEEIVWLLLGENNTVIGSHHYPVYFGEDSPPISASVGTILHALFPHIDKITAVVLSDEQRDILMEELDKERLAVPPIFTTEEVFESHVNDQIAMELSGLGTSAKAA